MRSDPRLALVTGASSGIGRATAETLAAAGWRLILVGRDEARLDEAARAVDAAGGAGRHRVHRADLTDDAAVEGLARTVSGPLDALVHSAGWIRLGQVAEAPVADLDRHYRINLRAPYLLTQRLLPALEAGGGQVVFLNSGSGLRARGGWSHYAASKFGLRALADSLRDEVAPRGIRVASVYPGRVATPMQREVRAMEGGDYRAEAYARPEDVAAQVAALLDLPSRAVVTDISVRPA